MVDNSLLEYVKKSLAQGLSHDLIQHTLIANGWPEASVKEALASATMPEVPKGPGFIPPQETHTALNAAVYPKRVKRNYEIYSSYSVILAFVLFFGLLILANKTVSDLGREFPHDITARLIAQTLLIIPFLIVAFMLHFGLTEKGVKYRILSQPYYLVSGWLLVRLLFNVSQYILSTQVVYGVYIVLGLIVVVLTGVIFFVQKFLRHHE